MHRWVSSHRIGLALGLILILATGLRVVSFIGYGYDGDDVGYADLAHSIVAGGFREAHERTSLIFPARIGILVPAAMSFKVFGVSEQALGVYPLVVSLAGILLAYVAGNVLFNERVIKVDDPDFYKGMKPLDFGDTPRGRRRIAGASAFPGRLGARDAPCSSGWRGPA